MAFDDRIIRITFDDDNEIDVFEDLMIQAIGQRTASPILNQCTVTIFNVKDDTRNRIATKYTPENLLAFGRTLIQRGNVTVEIGRESFGVYVLFTGSVSTVTLSNPPDIALSVNLISTYFGKSDIVSRNFGATTLISTICENVAESLDLSLSFNATDREISNAMHNGDLASQTQMIADFGNIQCTIDNDQLVVMDFDAPRNANFIIVDVNSSNGMIGVPSWSANGVQFRILATPTIIVGSIVRLNSIINPSVNDGLFKVLNILFDVTTRSDQFYYDCFCVRFKG